MSYLCLPEGRAGLLMKDAKQGGGYKNLSLAWSRAAKDSLNWGSGR